MPDPNDPTSSPFAGQSATMKMEPRGNRAKAMWIAMGIILLAIAGYFAVRQLNDPMRILPVFSAEKYFSNPDSIAGNTFKADLRVEADLGWKMGVGRLMGFSILNDGRQVAVLVPAKLGGAMFDKNQVYRVELMVEEGGLIRAKAFKKL